jgi:transposase InsO family protein
VSERTLRRWSLRADTVRRSVGRPRLPDDQRAHVRAVVKEALDRLGWTAGEPAMVEALPWAPRRALREALQGLKAERRRDLRLREAEARVRMEVLRRDVLWCLDSTHLGRAGRRAVEGQVLREAATRRTLSVTAGGTPTEDEVLLLMERMKATGRLPLVLGTDNGPAYVGGRLRQWLDAHRIVHLRNVPRTPRHNARVERAIGELKAESGLGSGVDLVDADHALRRLEEARTRLDERRPRACLGGRTAAAVDAAMPGAYTTDERRDLFEEVREEVSRVTGGLACARARCQASREAVFRVLERRSLIRRTRGGSPIPSPKPDTITC